MSLVNTTKQAITDTLGSVSAISNTFTNAIKAVGIYSNALTLHANTYIEVLEATNEYKKETNIENELSQLDIENTQRDFNLQSQMKLNGKEYEQIYQKYVQARKNIKQS